MRLDQQDLLQDLGVSFEEVGVPLSRDPRRDASPQLLNVNRDLAREPEYFVLNCSKCGLDVHSG